jgi:hypothetical protein
MKGSFALLASVLITSASALCSCGDSAGNVFDSHDGGSSGSGGRVTTGAGGSSGLTGSGGVSGSSGVSGSGGTGGSGGAGDSAAGGGSGSAGMGGRGGNGGNAGGIERDSGIDVIIIGTMDGGGTGGRGGGDAGVSSDAGTCPSSANAAACVACCDARYPGAFQDAFFGNECLYCAECSGTRICTNSTTITGPCLGCAQPHMSPSDCRFGSQLCPSLIACLKQCPTN